jgi:hypothetical protein
MPSDPAFNLLISNDQKVMLTSFGFKFGDIGTHTSRTIMLDEVSLLLQYCSAAANRSDYAQAVLEANCLGKPTLSTRKLSLQRLTELYAVDPTATVFRLLRDLWQIDEKGRPLLALFIALTRDPLLRATAPVVTSMTPGEEIARQKFADALRRATEGRLNESTLDKVVRNTASSWTQSGHLEGRSRKRRINVKPTPAATTLALILGYMMGLRGRSLLDTMFTRILDLDESQAMFNAMEAKRFGLLDIKTAGGMTVFSFKALLTEGELRRIHGST